MDQDRNQLSALITSLVIALLLGTFALPGYAAEPVPTAVQQLRWIENADPIADAKRSLDLKDHRLLGVNGYTWTIPGVSESDKFTLRKKYGIRVIDGTSDMVLNAEHERLINMAITYAKTYNQYLLSHANSK